MNAMKDLICVNTTVRTQMVPSSVLVTVATPLLLMDSAAEVRGLSQ